MMNSNIVLSKCTDYKLGVYDSYVCTIICFILMHAVISMTCIYLDLRLLLLCYNDSSSQAVIHYNNSLCMKINDNNLNYRYSYS